MLSILKWFRPAQTYLTQAGLLSITAVYLASCASAPTDNDAHVKYSETPLKAMFPLVKSMDLQTKDLSVIRSQLNATCARYNNKNASAFVHENPIFGTYANWHKACAELKSIHNDNLAFYIANMFKIYEVKTTEKSLFTGYYAPVVNGSFTKSDVYKYPLYAYPKDIYKADLGQFDTSLKGKTILARVDTKTQKIIPYYSRAEFEAGMGNKRPLVWLKNETDAFFMHIQGSGWVKLPTGERINVAYAGNNGHTYTAIGRTLIKKGLLTKENVTMDSIRKWLAENPKKSDEIFNSNKRFIFFQKSNSKDVKGSFAVPLISQKSLAVDPKFIPLGTPLIVNTTLTATKNPYRSVMFAQDTGAAITGGVRGDIYFGIGEEAGSFAGVQNSPGQLFVLVPKG